MTKSPEKHEITMLIDAARKGDSDASNELYSQIYNQLRAIAKRHRARWFGNNTINTTVLVHEAYMKLHAASMEMQDRNHFFKVASIAMRQILVNYAEKKKALRRGNGETPLELDEGRVAADGQSENVLALHEALEAFQVQDARRADVVVCRIFGGLTVKETADALDTSPATVKRDHDVALAWLRAKMKEGGNSGNQLDAASSND